MKASEREGVSHVVRRLSLGAHPDAIARLASTDEAIAHALDLTVPPAAPLQLAPPASVEEARDPQGIVEPILWWVGRMESGERLIEERLVWFWHDHFATSLEKVPSPYLMYRQHLTLRRHATGNFRDLLHAIAKDPAMLVYLDGITNAARQGNENFGRECMELFTLGRGEYTQDDVVAASRACSGWMVNAPGTRFARRDLPPWESYLPPGRHDDGPKTLLGVTANLGLDDALDVMLARPATARRIAAKLYRELVGLEPDAAIMRRLGDRFASDYAILPLVEAIVAERSFTSDQALRSRVRTPVEKLVGLRQAVPGSAFDVAALRASAKKRAAAGAVGRALDELSYVPFSPPDVAGYPKGSRLLGPHQLVHSFGLLAAVDGPPPGIDDVDDLFARFGLFDVSRESRRVVARQGDPARRLALVFGSPEYACT